jgi:predicted nucleotidyltransferase
MHPVVQQKLAEVTALCRRFQVQRLELFGSAAKGKFDPQRSDIDFLVEFAPATSGFADRYFGLLEALEAQGDHQSILLAGCLPRA